MKNLTGFYRFERNGNLRHLNQHYPSKKKLYDDMRGNGMRVIVILTDAEIDSLLKMTRKEFDYSQIGRRNKLSGELYDYIAQYFTLNREE